MLDVLKWYHFSPLKIIKGFVQNCFKESYKHSGNESDWRTGNVLVQKLRWVITLVLISFVKRLSSVECYSHGITLFDNLCTFCASVPQDWWFNWCFRWYCRLLTLVSEGVEGGYTPPVYPAPHDSVFQRGFIKRCLPIKLRS